MVLNGCHHKAFEESQSKQETKESSKMVSNKTDSTLDSALSLLERESIKMNIQIGNYTFTATLEKNNTVEELLQMIKNESITLHMEDYSGFEKVGSLGKNLSTNNCQITTVSGDIVLYNGNNIVIFYGSNSWNYTKIGRIDDLTHWKEALGNEDITMTLSLSQ